MNKSYCKSTDTEEPFYLIFTSLRASGFFILLITLFITSSCSAQQNALTRISSVERSDGQGHVVRFHLGEEATSFQFSQPRPYLIQFELLGEAIDTTSILITDKSQIIRDLTFYALPGGMGVDIYLNETDYYQADAYPDGASKDILLALNRTSRQQLVQYTNEMEPFAWADAPAKNVTEVETNTSVPTVNLTGTDYQKLKEKLQFDVVVLDAGHGGHDVGAIAYDGTYEKNIVLAITKKVGHYIEKNMPEVKVVYTRDDDTFIGLKERGHIANRANGDLFVSIHANAAASSQAHGTEVYFLGLERSQTALEVMQRENNVVDLDNGNSEEKISEQELFIYELANSANIAASQKLAGMIAHQFRERAMRNSRGVKQARFVVLYHASMPAILVETGFITNPEEGHYLTTEYGQSIIASAIFRAIRNYKEQFAQNQGYTTGQ